MDPTQCRYQLANLENIRLRLPGHVEIATERESITIGMDRFQLLLQFSSPATIAEAHSLLVDDIDLGEITALVHDFEKRGLLIQDGSQINSRLSILDYLDERYSSEKALAALRHHLSSGRCLHLENAFRAEFAERMFDSLSSHEKWLTYEEFSRPEFAYHHHNIYEKQHFTREMFELDKALGSKSTKNLIATLSNRDCGGDLAFGAGLYLPGDFSLPHSDAQGVRNVAMVWYLAKDWDPRWGGQFYWSPTRRQVDPAFNSIILFNVSETTYHFVTHVRPTSRGRRFSINTWWQASDEDAVRKPLRNIPPSAEPAMIAGLSLL